MGLITQKIKLRKNGKETEIFEAEVDTGASDPMIDREIIKKLGIEPVDEKTLFKAGTSFGKARIFNVDLMINNCPIERIDIIEGDKNLLGRSVLQRINAKIDEENHNMTFTCPTFVTTGDIELR